MMILFNDRFVSPEDVQVSFKDRGYYFGDGVYEVFRIYNGILFEKETHLARLERSAREVRISLPCRSAEIEARLERLVVVSGVTNGTLYMQITRGEAQRAHPFPMDATPVLMGYCTEVKRPTASMQDGITAVTVPDIRWLRCDIKSLNLLPNVLAKQEALDRGCGEAILHRNGTVTECSASNVMMVKNGTIYTHPADNYILHGITRTVLLKLAKQEGLPIEERPFTLAELNAADEVFICGTTVEVTPVIQVDGRPLPAGPLTRRLQAALDRYIGV
jgi:D-alanine transaminase